MRLPILGLILLFQHCRSYYQAQYAQVAPLQASRDVCVNMMPPYIGSKPFRNRIPLKLEIDAKWISFKRLSVCVYSAPDKYQAFSGMMVQVIKDNLPYGDFESDNRMEYADCPPGEKNLVCFRSPRKLLQAAVNWVSPPDFDVYTQQLTCIVTVIAPNQKYWTIEIPVEAAPHKYPDYGNFTNELKPGQVQTSEAPTEA